jgi:hypothetical protein
MVGRFDVIDVPDDEVIEIREWYLKYDRFREIEREGYKVIFDTISGIPNVWIPWSEIELWNEGLEEHQKIIVSGDGRIYYYDNYIQERVGPKTIGDILKWELPDIVPPIINGVIIMAIHPVRGILVEPDV